MEICSSKCGLSGGDDLQHLSQPTAQRDPGQRRCPTESAEQGRQRARPSHLREGETINGVCYLGLGLQQRPLFVLYTLLQFLPLLGKIEYMKSGMLLTIPRNFHLLPAIIPVSPTNPITPPLKALLFSELPTNLVWVFVPFPSLADSYELLPGAASSRAPNTTGSLYSGPSRSPPPSGCQVCMSPSCCSAYLVGPPCQPPTSQGQRLFHTWPCIPVT